MSKRHARPASAQAVAAPQRASGGGGGRGYAARQDQLRHRVGDSDMEKQGDWGDWFGGDSWMADFDWSDFSPLSWFGSSDQEEDGPAPAPTIDSPSTDISTPAVDGPAPVEDGDDQILDTIHEAEEDANPDLARRPVDVRTGLYGAVIGRDGGAIDVHSGPAADSTVSMSIADGTACRIKSVSDGFVEIAFRQGDAESTGWVNQALFSDQPRLFKDDDNSALMEDYTWTHFAGDQSMPEGADGRTVQQGGLADCYFVAAMNAVGMANPEFLRESIVYDDKTGMYKCRFFEEAGWDRATGKPKTQEVWIEVDGYLPTKGSSLDPAYADDNDSTVWGAIYEKAYAQWKGGFPEMGDGGYGSKAMEEMTGNPASYQNTSQLSEDEVIPFFEKAKADGLAIYTGSNSTGEVETQTPMRKTRNENTWTGTVKQAHKWNHLEPGTVRVEDLSGNVGTARDTGREGDKTGGFRGSHVEDGEVVYDDNTLSLSYTEGKAPEASSDLQVTAEFKGMILPEKEVIGWHGYSFDHVVDGSLIQLYNPWGSYQPKPLTPAEYLASYGSLSTAQVPQAKGES